jgi:hypothetical protein
MTFLATSAFAQAGGPAMRRPNVNFAPTISADQAVQVVKASFSRLEVGRFWVLTGPAGDTKAKIALSLDGRIVSQVELSPSTGEILAKGEDIQTDGVTADPNRAISRVREALPNLQVAAARRSPEGEWNVELALNSAVVAEVSVNGRDGSIITDWGASREATLY